MLALVLFVLSCFGLTLYLWLAFGGSVPLQPKGYRLNIPFADASGLLLEADVRIAGVNVGKVKAKHIIDHGRYTVVEIDVKPKYAPRPKDTRAILRLKTVLGESYVQLSAGTAGAPKIKDGGSLARGQVQQTVHIQDVLRTFAPSTRRELATWLSGQGAALRGGGPALNAALAELAPLGDYGSQVLVVLDQEQQALGGLIRDGGASLDALTQRRGQLRDLVANASQVFHVTAQRNAELADTVHILPTFLREMSATEARLGTFSTTATPLITQLRPAARELQPVLRSTAAVAPSVEQLLTGLGPLTRAARPGLPALSQFLGDATPLLARIKPWLGSIEPALSYFAGYRRELTGLFANVAASTQSTLPSNNVGTGPLHYARASVPINPEALTALPARFSSNRSNPYPRPDDYANLRNGLSVFGSYLCSTNPDPGLSPDIPTDLRTQIQDYYFTDDPGGPPCKAQAPLGGTTTFPHLQALP
jgi:virulence factor Mce-like protein